MFIQYNGIQKGGWTVFFRRVIFFIFFIAISGFVPTIPVAANAY